MMTKTGAITIVGGGIAGVQTALDIANSGFKVYMVEENPSVGGVMAQLDKTFPTNDCSSCMMGPKLVELANHPNIEILAYTEVVGVKGDPGNFTVTVKKKARAVDPKKCVGCGICAEKCPTKVDDEFNFDLNKRKAIYVPYPQAVPLVYTIDRGQCRFFQSGKCKICEKVCENNAIDFDQKDELVELKSGAVILAGGYEPFNPVQKGAYGYGRWPNVVTSLEYERILSAAGPFQGHVQRLSDGKEPKRIAWVQCVGSRDKHIGNGYCSSVCCMYATKQAMVTKEHDDEASATIFTIDIRAHGKGFDRFYERSKSENGVRYVRSMISRIVPNPKDDTLVVNYINAETHEIVEEAFDMIVLSVGLRPNLSMMELAKRIGVDINKEGFCATRWEDTVQTSREGIFVCGAIQEPKDIPDSIQQGSSAAEKAMALLAESRGTLITTPEKTPEINVRGKAPRVGVFVCHCGINIASSVDVKKVAEVAKGFPHVMYSGDCMFACSTDMQGEIKRLIAEHNLNRVVVASCSPRTHEPLFRKTLEEVGLNPYLFEMANIRDQCSWVHQKEPELATEKAIDLVRMSVARAVLLQPLYDVSFDVQQSALILGGGIAGMTAALGVSEQGYPSVLIEKQENLGGLGIKPRCKNGDFDPPAYTKALIEKVKNDPKITVLTNATLESITGSCGSFTSTVVANGEKQEFRHGVGIIAIGAKPYMPTEYLFGTHQNVKILPQLEEFILGDPEGVKKLNKVVMIQCVGSREPDKMYCSRVCCTAAVQNALRLKELNPSMDISILYRDVRTFGFKEDLYAEAREKGVQFYRYDIDKKPEAKTNGEGVSIEVFDQQLQIPVLLSADMLILAGAMLPQEGMKKLGETMRLPLDQDGFFMEAHPKLRPLDVATEGIFLCGLCQGPKFANEVIAQARGAVSRATIILSKTKIVSAGVINHVREDMCRACGECEKACSFTAISVQTVNGVRRAVMNEGLCTGCGACNVACPTGAASLAHFTDNQVDAIIAASA